MSFDGNFESRTLVVWFTRYSLSFLRKLGREFETIEIASNAPLIAPDIPIAKVPTGTPRGICTMESSESIPFLSLIHI